ncbi:MAG: 4-(cytidine 5'-diphospho)-2-C-methyl-D-erythritol kinase [Cytophagales bacterium]|nr:4-(cytidine 5'-diphospho)-2-C-methyl-D-erythritol kinase [Cytophagales bacterium]MCA6368447.1 4-(cytidine 5'-diphospho)-2-C-methyl-D-erythritol kinase [Cytophagales bacterium]MCA6371767.1 4-(cytidine 5'-diphospho)-2-C-methyl-D-erythritol kinase [Cytophagales bacterium]MCA6376418.1 4-(cytidine 5'-diphospho)-2-C-methyl-D-erythritol kinase [Cytophagales bacterium]MCA6384966.1 4-(cytidine 5'-diphospho)-2-C-methyl-D-erythritol kinase [Cytophagales bacterium]
MIAFPPCKINLGLNILSKRQDGFHNIETCFYPIPWTDILEVIPAGETEVTFSGNSIPGRAEQNLCLKAYELVKNDFDIEPVKIHLHKIIPIGAGLGGGSSDAAFTLRLLSHVFDLNLSPGLLRKYASQLGSDCSFFMQDKPQLGFGKGEILHDLDITLKGFWLILVKPPIHISTQQAYSGVVPKLPQIKLAEILQLPVAQWKGLLKNDFEESIFKLYPEVATIKNQLYAKGAVYASMSGSGSSVFGLFEKPVQLKKSFPNMEYWEGILQ